MVNDPYAALKLPHTATDDQIKRSYRELARIYHPDRMRQESPGEQQIASDEFAKIAAAYALLSDPKRKTEYDHIYKYGGYDIEEEKTCMNEPANQEVHRKTSRKRKSTGIGYSCADPFSYLFTNGRVQSKMAVCGVQIPSRLQMMQPNSGLRFAFSHGQGTIGQDGTRRFTSQTTHFSNGQKITRTETTIYHPDGRKETVVESADFCERHVEQSMHQPNLQVPWYALAWDGLKQKLSMCYSPCSVVQQ